MWYILIMYEVLGSAVKIRKASYLAFNIED
jgi:hypothetical protein